MASVRSIRSASASSPASLLGTFVFAILAWIAGSALDARAAGPSAFCHTVDGIFTDCLGGPTDEEWSDIPADVFLMGGSYVSADQNPGATRLYLMYEYPLGTTPLGLTECGSVEFDVQELGNINQYRIEIGNCAIDGFDVFVNAVKLPEHLEEDIEAAAGFGPTPDLAVPHQTYELSVPLVLVYSPDDPRFWTSGFPAPPQPPLGDFDGDAVTNLEDNCPFTSNPDQLNADADALGDACDGCPGDDSDGDGVADGVDNCPSVRDHKQTDKDLDDVGDVCDACSKGDIPACGVKVADHDGDGLHSQMDNCPVVFNPLQPDTDTDGFGDECDNCPNDETNSCGNLPECIQCFPDSDGDGVADDSDNCRNAPNALQEDGDGDAVGDICDSCPLSDQDDCAPLEEDDDGDGVENDEDNCAADANALQADEDGDSFGDVCDPCLDDPANTCVDCDVSPLPRSVRSVGVGEIMGHGSILTANSDATTDSEPRAQCGSPELCGGDDPKLIVKYVKKLTSTRVKCTKQGTVPCDLAKAKAVGPISVGCRTVIDCAMEGALETALGTNNPVVTPYTDSCGLAIASTSGKFLGKMVSNQSKGRDDLLPNLIDSSKGKIAGKCADPIPATANLGGDCTGLTAHAAALDCLFGSLTRATPLPR